MTLTDDTIVSYQIIGNFYSKFQSGIAWNDNKINIQWPGKPKIISPRDKNFTHII
jgi:dTDP-4-dehydrorhamnose 3,5-epimerase-like enzyme